MSNWLLWALLAMFTWGFWGLFPKLAVSHADPTTILFYEAIASAFFGLLIALSFGGIPPINFQGGLFAVLTGMFAILGAWFYLFASKDASVSLVVIITALYPIVTILLAAVFLKEPLGTRHLVAIILAVASIVLLATEKSPT